MNVLPRERPNRLVLIGHPVAHSLSPLFQNAALKSAGLSASYDALDVTPEALNGVLRDLARGHVAGNVTIPHKEAFAAACTRTTELAARVGAVNTFWHEKGALVGDNTDVVGARIAIAAVLDAAPAIARGTSEPAQSVAPLRVTVLGAGGAAAAVIVALESFAPVAVTVCARTPSRAQALAARLGVSITVIGDADVIPHDPVMRLATEHDAAERDAAVHDAAERDAAVRDAAVRNADLVINCTPIGLRDESMPVAIEALAAGARVLDLIPKLGDTRWVRAARAAGHVAEDGTRMLIEQGAAAFERWFDMVPDRASMWRSLKVKVEATGAARGTSSKPANRLV